MIHETRALLRTADFGLHLSGGDPEVLYWLPAVASLTCLVPAALAARYHQLGIAGLLLAAAILPSAQFACSRSASSSTAGLLLEILSGATYVCSNLSVVQLSLLVLGPCDPYVKVSSLVIRTSRGSCSAHGPAFLALSTTVGPAMSKLWSALCALALAMVWALASQWALQDFDRLTVVVDQVLISAAFVSFWFCNGGERRSLARQVLLHANFWRRLLVLVLPVTAVLLLAAVQTSTSTPAALQMQAALRATTAILAVLAIWSVLAVKPLAAGSDSPCAHWVLYGCAAIMAPVLILAVVVDAWENPGRWPATLSTAATTQIGGFALAVSAVPLVALTTASIEIIDSLPPQGTATGIATFAALKPNTVRTCHIVGCQLARFGMAAGLVAAVFSEKEKLGRSLHTGFAVVMFAAYWAAMVLSAVGSDLTERHGKARALMAACILIGMGTHLGLFLVANHYIFPKFIVPKSLDIAYGFSEFGLLALITSYPMTWIPEAISWQKRGYTVLDATPNGPQRPPGKRAGTC